MAARGVAKVEMVTEENGCDGLNSGGGGGSSSSCGGRDSSVNIDCNHKCDSESNRVSWLVCTDGSRRLESIIGFNNHGNCYRGRGSGCNEENQTTLYHIAIARNQRTKIDMSSFISSIMVPLVMLVIRLALLAQSVAILASASATGQSVKTPITGHGHYQSLAANRYERDLSLNDNSSRIHLERQFEETIKLINETVDERAYLSFYRLLRDQDPEKKLSKLIFNNTLFSKRALDERIKADKMNVSIYAGQLTNRPEIILVILRNDTTILVTRRANKYYYWVVSTF